MSYAAESASLDRELLDLIAAWHRTGVSLPEPAFDELALRLLEYQLRYNEPYARYCARFGVTPSSLPRTWKAIPPVPAAAFKSATLATFDPVHAALCFKTSGTTSGTGGRHFMETAELYDAALLAAFDRFILSDAARLAYLNLVPNPAERPQSSLGHMMRTVAQERGVGDAGWYIAGDVLLVDAVVTDMRADIAAGQPVCLTATAFALANLLDELERRDILLPLPAGSRLIETGGFKGRTRSIAREELYARACRTFAMPHSALHSEYGMTELSSQYYDAPNGHERPEARRKHAPPWLRTRVVAPDGSPVPAGSLGALVHVDLANRSSCIAIATEDLGVQFHDGLVIVGREGGAALRGCSLDAERLLPD
jgi:Acyl-protein synthetase, LuxE